MKDVKSSLFSLFVGTITSLTVWLAIVLTVDPTKSDIITRAAFFASFFLGLTGILSFVFIYILSNIQSNSTYSILSTSVVHSSIISLAVVLILILQALRVLGWWEMFIVILLILLLELYMQAQQKTSS